ncbi:hypothetical protein [Henriciella aquimarina]|uniref:hypothetical protein n=1 Tax=Henriciella aquimarina TaxID=545261 RepID=UPI0009FE7792|nr:hypothetical protein [Henriciella aquimarina]
MKRIILATTAALAFASAPALADEARTPPPSEPYYAPPQTGCETLDLKVYFEPGTAELTTFSRDVIREAREQLSGCAVVKLDATAKASDAKTKSEKLSLAEARRVTVMKELQAHGIRSPETATKSDVSAEASDSVMTRNVDVVLEAEPAMVG